MKEQGFISYVVIIIMTSLFTIGVWIHQIALNNRSSTDDEWILTQGTYVCERGTIWLLSYVQESQFDLQKTYILEDENDWRLVVGPPEHDTWVEPYIVIKATHKVTNLTKQMRVGYGINSTNGNIEIHQIREF